MANQKPIPGRADFRSVTPVGTDFTGWHRLSNLSQTAMAYMIWLATYGNGVATGILQGTVEQNRSRKWFVAVHSCVTIVTARGTK